MNLHRDILWLAIPSIVSNITVPLLGLVDVAIMGHIGDARFIGAIAVGSMIFNVMYWLFGFLRMGTSGLTAQAYGRENQAETALILRQSMKVALSIGMLIILLQWPLRMLALWLMQPSEEVAQIVKPYYNICVWGAPAVLGLYAMTGWYVGMQNTRIPMMVAIIQNVVNILASLFFVFALHMQAEGVALGTLVAQWAGFALSLKLRVESGKLRVQSVECRVQSVEFATARQDPLNEKTGAVANSTLCTLHSTLCTLHSTLSTFHSTLFTVNRDIFLRTLCLVAVNLYFTSAGAQQGTLVLAVNTLLMQLFTIFSYFMDGFAYAGEALSGRYYGAGNQKMLQSVVRCLFGWGTAMVVLFTLLYGVGGETFLTLLTSDHEVISASSEYFVWALLIPVCGMAAFVWDGVFIGITATRGMLEACFVAALAFFAIWFLGRNALGNHALWLALNIYLLLRGVVQTIVYQKRLALS